ncbi:ATP-binding cassette transporter [Mycena venus]|uniref:ATP-binding cassette transporter n=1 Tax=Mycena venus TaxID=2733690 RepID=A0A8H6YFG7_9AGAR|nr:ATP-binding cassette transporter [Mycena venus]
MTTSSLVKLSQFSLYAGAASGVTLLLHLFGSKQPVALVKPGPEDSVNVASGNVAKHGGSTIFAFKVARLAGCLALFCLAIRSLVINDKENLERGAVMLNVAMCILHGYSSILGAISVSASTKWSQIAVRHLNILLLCTFSVYFYRDVFPLATFTLVPLDLAEGRVLWAKITILFVVSSVIPLVIPREYTPSTPRSFAYLEGNPWHVFFGLTWVFGWECVTMSVLIVTMASTAFISPIGINRLLNYLEHPEEESFMKPWFWILLIFIGPCVSSLSFQGYLFVATRMVCELSVIITQLVYEHALRIRVKAETPVAGKANPGIKNPATNLMGKITNLVTTHLSHIAAARKRADYANFWCADAIFDSEYMVISSALVGMGVMLAMFPLPGRVLRMAQRAQKLKLRQTDARVQTVSEIINVLRMIKMFGWESQMDKKIAEKREEELNYIWQRKLLDLLNTILNLFIPIATMLATFDWFASQDSVETVARDEFDNAVDFRDATFAWSNDAPSTGRFLLKVEGEVLFKQGCVNLIVGPTGSGKTSLLMALLGEIHLVTSSNSSSWFNLPRGNGVSALDVHTAKWIVDKCFSGDLVKDRTILLVTHNVSLTGSIAQFFVSVDLDGRVCGRDSISEALTKDTMLAEEIRKDNEILEIAEKAMDAPSPAAPKKTQGNGTLGATWFLGYWESQYGNGVHVAVFYYLGIFCGLMGGGLGIYALSFILYNLRAFRASMYLHAQLIQSILRTTFRWLDVTPTSRIVARCTADIGAVYGPIVLGLWSLLELSISMLVKLSAVILLTPVFFFPAQCPTRAERGYRSGDWTLWDNTSIRAYGAQNTVIKKSFDRINRLSSLERIQRYIEIEHEPEPTAAGIPPAYWPTSGNIHVDKLSAKYSPEGPKVLHDISFNLKSGERVGVVGRTGSGKSSLTLSLLRCIFIEGAVYYDGIPASSLNLDALRTNITIIPQVPELLSGSLRSNLDIIGQFDDVVLNGALRAAGLSSLQDETTEGRLTLDSVVSSGGTNISVGTRQIIALARVIVLRRKLLILDEGVR